MQDQEARTLTLTPQEWASLDALPGGAQTLLQLFSQRNNLQAGTLFDSLVATMVRLRDRESGCPWDAEQTNDTLKKYVIEEAYEVVEAIESGSVPKLREELGDLLLQVVFLSQLSAENSHFDISGVIQTVVEKLVRRHPHVFGDISVENTTEVLANWEQIKRAEPGYEDRVSVLDGIPPSLPALMRALEVSKRAVKVGFEWPSVGEILDKVEEEIGELRQEIAAGQTNRAADELGDLLFTLVNVARQLKIDPEDSLRRMVQRFSTRFRSMESQAASEGKTLQDLTLDQMEQLWQAAKLAEKMPLP